jgi:hypothetical protein
MRLFKRSSSLIVVLAAVLSSATAVESFQMAKPAANWDLPPITLKKRADFVVLRASIENDSRDAKQRKKEVYATILGLVNAAKKTKKVELHSGTYVIDKDSYEIPLQKGRRPDTSATYLYIKIPLKKDADVPKLTKELKKFVADAKVEGRTQITPGSTGLSILDPEKYRYELIGEIAKDLNKISELLGGSYKFTPTGLDQRIQVRRVSVSEVELYTQYKFSVSPK